MRITGRELRQIIKEELRRSMLREDEEADTDPLNAKVLKGRPPRAGVDFDEGLMGAGIKIGEEVKGTVSLNIRDGKCKISKFTTDEGGVAGMSVFGVFSNDVPGALNGPVTRKATFKAMRPGEGTDQWIVKIVDLVVG